MIVAAHVTGCLAEQPPDSGSAGDTCQQGGMWGQKAQVESKGTKTLMPYDGCLLISTIINVRKHRPL